MIAKLSATLFLCKKKKKNKREIFANFLSESRSCDLIGNLRVLREIDFQKILFQIILLKHL